MAIPEITSERPEEEIAAGLVQRVRQGDARAEAELVEGYSRGLLSMLRPRAGDPALADALHQETFRIVLERLRRQGIEDPAHLSAFILQTARNLFLGDWRKTSRRGDGPDLDGAPDPPDPTAGQLDDVLRQEEARQVR